MLTVQKSIKRLKELEQWPGKALMAARPKKELSASNATANTRPESRRHQGHGPPADVIFVIDSNKEASR